MAEQEKSDHPICRDFGIGDPNFDVIFHHCYKVMNTEFLHNDTYYCGLCVGRTRSKAFSKARAEQYYEECGNLFDETVCRPGQTCFPLVVRI